MIKIRVVKMKKRIFLTLALLAVLLAFLSITGVKAPVGWSRWYTTVVDSAGTVGGFGSSIALDSDGSPHISYFDNTNNDLKFAEWTGPGGGWSIETVDSAAVVNWATAIALDSGGNPHISYRDDTPGFPEFANGVLKYAKWTGSAWSIETVDSTGDVGYGSSIAVDSSDNPRISYVYYTGQTGVLKYAKWTGSAWSIETVDAVANVGDDSSIALDSSDNPHIAYQDFGNGDLKYAQWTGSAWSIETVDSIGDVGMDLSIALDSGDNPHIAYFDFTNGDLKYARWTGTAWSIQTVDSTLTVGLDPSIALDSQDNPHISYGDYYPGADLKYARWTGIGWSTEIVDSVGVVGWTSSLALDSDDVPHISYGDRTNDDLKYASLIVPTNMWSSDNLGNPRDVFVPGETVYVTCPQPRTYSTTVTLYVVADKTAWNDGDALIDVSGGSELATILWGPSGSTQTFQIWVPPLIVGSYDIVMDKDNDGVFDAGLDLVDSVLITGFNVIPEVPFGTAMTFLSMIIALVGFAGFKRFRPKFQLK